MRKSLLILSLVAANLCSMPAVAAPMESETAAPTASEAVQPESALSAQPESSASVQSKTTTTAVSFSIGTPSSRPDDNVISFQPIGRVLLDAAAYGGNDGEEFNAGATISEARLGVIARYGKWTGKVELGYSYGQFAARDLYVQYNFKPNLFVCAGNFIHPYGLQSATSSSMKISFEEPTSSAVFNFARLVGINFTYYNNRAYAALSANVESASLLHPTNELGRTGYGCLSRFVWHPISGAGEVVQFGFSYCMQSPQYNSDKNLSHHVWTSSAYFPTKVARVKAVEAVVTDACNYINFTPELLLNFGGMALEAQYFYSRVNRHNDLQAFNGWGAYGALRGLVRGGKYRYNNAMAALATPSAGSVELVALYNHTNLSHRQSGIFGGRINDVSLTANWYVNKYVIWRFRAGYTHRWDHSSLPTVDLGSFQTRLQILF